MNEPLPPPQPTDNPLPPPAPRSAQSAEAGDNDPPTRGRRAPILFALALLLLAVGVAAVITGPSAESSAEDDRDAAKAARLEAQDAVDRAEVALGNSQERFDSIEAEAQTDLENALESINLANRLFEINARQVAIVQEQRDISLNGRNVDQFNALIDEGNNLITEYNDIVDQLNTVLR